MKHVLITLPFDESYKKRLAVIAGDTYTLHFQDTTWSRAKYMAILEQANVILGEPAVEDLRFCQNLEWMQITWSGIDYYVQSPYFPSNAILSCSTGLYGPIIAEHILAMTLALGRRLPEYTLHQQEKKWDILLYDKPLEGSNVLILGAGDIGTTLAWWMRPMVGKIIGVRRTLRNCPECFDQMITLDSLDEYLPWADYVLCCLPKTAQTDHLLGESRLRSMKADAVLVNAGRGNLIDLNGLCRVLNDGHLWGVGLDVAEEEPLPPEHPIWNCQRCMITPHAAGNSFSQDSPTQKKISEFILENFQRFVLGQPVLAQADFSTGYCAKG